MKLRGDRPIVITDADRSQEDQLRTRTVRYLLLMSIRLVSLLAAGVLVMTQPPLLGLWLALCAVGMIIIPWVAVVLANDRLPKDRHRRHSHRQTEPATPTLPPAPHPGRTIEADEHRGEH